MRQSKFITSIIAANLCFIFACSHGTKINEKTIEQKNYLPNEIQTAVKDFVPAEQEFVIDPTKCNSVLTKNGALISIPPNAFEGDPQSVTLKVVEVYSIADMILSGIQTKSDKGWLSSSGMMLINAYADKNTVNFKEGMSAIINIPAGSDKQDPANRFFEGEQVGNEMQWKETSENRMPDHIIPFPPKYLYNDKVDYYSIELEQYHDKILANLVDPSLKTVEVVSKYNWWKYEPLEKYKNTVISTREFQSMYWATSGLGNDSIIEFYFKNNALPLFRIDSMYWSGDSDYSEYKNHRYGQVIKLDYDEMDLNTNGYEQLVKSGSTPENAILTMSYYELRKKIIKNIDADHESRFAQQFNTMLLSRMGWLNIDKYFNDDSKAIKLKINVPEATDNTVVYLVDKRNKIVIRAMRDKNIFFFGTTSTDPVKLPSSCSVYTFDTKKGEFYFSETLLDEGDQELSVNMQKIEKTEMAELFKEMMK